MEDACFGISIKIPLGMHLHPISDYLLQNPISGPDSSFMLNMFF